MTANDHRWAVAEQHRAHAWARASALISCGASYASPSELSDAGATPSRTRRSPVALGDVLRELGLLLGKTLHSGTPTVKQKRAVGPR